MLSVDEEEQKRIAEQEAQAIAATPESKRRKHNSTGLNMGKEITTDQKAIVKMYVVRGVSEGVVKCCYCDKEISSRNVDRWASHLRGCVKTPEDVKTQIQPFRGNASSPSAPTSGSLTPIRTVQQSVNTDVQTAAAAVTGAPTAFTVPTAVPMAAPTPTPNPMSSGHNEVFKVHVSKDYMKFNAAHFIAYKVWLQIWFWILWIESANWIREERLTVIFVWLCVCVPTEGIPGEAART